MSVCRFVGLLFIYWFCVCQFRFCRFRVCVSFMFVGFVFVDFMFVDFVFVVCPSFVGLLYSGACGIEIDLF